MRFERNEGQWHPACAYVRTLTEADDCIADYHGCGVYLAKIGLKGQLLGLVHCGGADGANSLADLNVIDPEWPTPGPVDDGKAAWVELSGSCYQLIALHGSAAAALLGALGVGKDAS